MQLLQDSHEFMVLGSLGTGGLGKSSFMNVCAGLHIPQPSHTSPNRLGSAPFPVRPPASAKSADPTRHASQGIQLRVNTAGSGERLLCLDTQPLLSASVLSDLTAHTSPLDLAGPPAAVSSLASALTTAVSSQQTALGTAASSLSVSQQVAAVGPEVVAALHDLQLAVFMLCSCHTVGGMLACTVAH